MKKDSRFNLQNVTLVSGGALFILAAVFARQLNIDNNDRWGSGRFVLLGCGIFLWFVLFWLHSASFRTQTALWFHSLPFVTACRERMSRLSEWWSGSAWVRWQTLAYRRLAALPGLRYLAVDKERQARFWAAIGLGLTILVYTWLATAGTMTRLTPISSFIDKQAEAFLHGQYYLLDEPPAELLALDNPYDLAQRANVKYLWDASLYQGKYYLYWGPFPALLECGYRLLTHQALGDEAFGFLFLVLLAGITTLWLLELRRIFAPNSKPIWMLFFVLMAGLVSPIGFDISWLSVYVVSALSAQFFLFCALFLARKGFYGRDIGWWRWALAGLLLGLVLSARINLILVVGWTSLFLIVQTAIYHRKDWHKRARQVLVMGLPLALVIGLIMAYNAARFDSPFEFGSRYQLTVTNINDFYGSVVSASYIPANLYIYLFQPPGLKADFPFLYSNWLKENSWPFFIRLQKGYLFTDPVDGLLWTAPFLVFLWFPLKKIFHSLGEWRQKNRLTFNRQQISLLGLFLGGGLIAIVFILFFYYPTMRYLIDGIPSLILVAVIGAWMWLADGKAGWLKSLFVFLLCFITIICGFLLCINGSHDYFEQANPDLYFRLIAFFSGG